MADLLGVLLFPSDLSKIRYHGVGNLPQFKATDASPYGKYHAVFLNKETLRPDQKQLRLRPTGPNGSGPYFNAVLSGNYGVRSAKAASTAWGAKVGPCIDLCSYRNDRIVDGGQWYKKTRYIEYLYTDGQTVICYEIWANEPGATYRTHLAHFCAYSIRRVATSPNWARNPIDCWYYTGDDASVNWYTMDQIKQRYDYFAWSVLSGVQSGHIDPQLSYEFIRKDPGYGDKLSLTQNDISFSHGELTAFEWWDLTGVLEGKYRALAGEAFYNAAQNLPKTTCNTIANVIESAGSIASLLEGDITKLLPSNKKDAWLFYRYQYSTTKMDILDYREFTERLTQLASLPIIRSDGVASNSSITAHCTIEVDPTFLIPESTKEWLKSYGFKLSLLNVWDMIPYSFVVDWFFHIGSFLELMENEQWMYTIPIKDAWTSFTTYGPGAQRTYFRIPGTYRANCPFLDYSQRGASGKTIVKRVLDSIALFT